MIQGSPIPKVKLILILMLAWLCIGRKEYHIDDTVKNGKLEREKEEEKQREGVRKRKREIWRGWGDN